MPPLVPIHCPFNNEKLFSSHILYLQAHENGYNDNILWEFTSDGSVQKYGFKIQFSENSLLLIFCYSWKHDFLECAVVRLIKINLNEKQFN